MKTNIIIFVLGFIVAFGIGYLVFEVIGNDTANETASDTNGAQSDGGNTSTTEEPTEADSVPSEAEPLAKNNCLSCHAVESLAAPGGTTGPDLSNVYSEIKGKHGKELDEFLQAPTSAVMSSVIEANPLSEDERKKIVEALKIASER